MSTNDEKENVEQRLKLNMCRRVKKLKKLRRRLRIWGVGEVLAIALAVWPLVTRVFLDNLPFFSEGGAFFGAGWAQVLAMVAAGFVGALLCAQQYKRDKDKFDRLRSGTIVLLEAASPVCECKWLPCDCKDELIRRMKDKYDINLSY